MTAKVWMSVPVLPFRHVDRAEPGMMEPRSIVVGDGPDALDAILRAGCALAVWRRPLPGNLAALASLAHRDLDDVEVAIAVEDVAIGVAASLGAAGYPLDIALPLARDMTAMAERHAALRRWASVRLRLDWIETDACRRFHADMLETRLLVTYVGRGTQWRTAAEPDTAAREASAGDVLMLKGRLLAPDAPVLHRSPPIGCDGGRRLLLTVDAAPRR